MSEKKKKSAWKSPESCNLDDEECILEKINEVTRKKPTDEIVIVGDFHQAREGGLGTRVGIIKRKIPIIGMQTPAYSTHLLTYQEDGSIALFYGHYDLTLKEAIEDLRKRDIDEKGDLFGLIKELTRHQQEREKSKLKR